MTAYVTEQFSQDERDLLRHYFTNLDGPVFALVNLPEVVRGALFARYSRSSKSLRRLFLDEFIGDLDISGDASVDATVGLARAEQLYEKVFSEYGDDSVAQLGGVHLACEQASNILTKVLERGRLMSYLEQSTRYIPYDSRLESGHYRYWRDSAVLDSSLGARYVGDMDRAFDTYGDLLEKLQTHLARSIHGQGSVPDMAFRRAIRAKALDCLRGLLPAGTLSNLGMYGSGQAYEYLLLRMRHDPLPEVREYSVLIHDELTKVIPSFLSRLDRPDRGGQWASYLAERHDAMDELVTRLWPVSEVESGVKSVLDHLPRTGFATDWDVNNKNWSQSVTLVDFDPDGEEKVLVAMCFPYADTDSATLRERIRQLTAQERSQIGQAYVGTRINRRHRPSRALEATAYRFEIVSDYGAFRDLQRHRMLTVEWQPLGAKLGYVVPEEVDQAGVSRDYVESIERSIALYDDMVSQFPSQAAYALPLACNIRYVMHLNAREAMHLLELRSSPQGHPAYRWIAQEMHRQIGQIAGHRAIAAAMNFVDYEASDLGRLDAERRAIDKLGNKPAI